MNEYYDGTERRTSVGLSEEQIELIAEKAATKALNKIYAEVGKNVVTKVLWIVGVAALGLVMFLSGKGVIKLG